jgi:hypothetical protein
LAKAWRQQKHHHHPAQGWCDWHLSPRRIRPDTRLLQRTRTRTSQKKCPKIIARKQKIQQLADVCWGPHHHPHPPLPRATQPQYHMRKEKVLGKGHEQTTKKTKILKCLPRSMLPTTWVPGRVLDWRGFLVADTPVEASSARVLLLTLRGARGTRRETYSTYRTVSAMEALGRKVVAWDLLVEDAPARFSLTFTPAGLSSVGIGSTKLCPNS